MISFSNQTNYTYFYLNALYDIALGRTNSAIVNLKNCLSLNPDFEDAYSQGMSDSDIEAAMEENRTTLNAELPAYSQISRIKIYPEEFEKTPKKSIKRFLYQDVK